MLLLTSITDQVQVITGSAGTINVHADWIDNTPGAAALAGRTNTAITTAATTAVVASPASGKQRNIKTLLVYNNGVSNNDITVQHTDGTNISTLYKQTLLPNRTIQYIDEAGFVGLNPPTNAFPGALFGLTLANISTTGIQIATGQCASDAVSPILMPLTAALGKNVGTAWAVGGTPAAPLGGLDTGTVSATAWYYVWLIRRSDTGVVDALFSLSATAPTMPANYDMKRRIGAVRRSAGNLLAFRQIDDRFLFTIPVTDANTLTLTSNVRTNVTLTCPPNMVAMFRAYGYAISPSTTGVLLQPTAETAAAINYGTTPLMSAYSEVTNEGTAGEYEVDVDANSQIGVTMDAATTNSRFSVTTKGWYDTRGRMR